jgi:putative N6-adenine-specific DNA methylase
VASAAWRLPLEEPGDPSNGSHLLLQLRLDRDVCTVSVDTTGELLHHRGYRQETSVAPARETLAAAMLWWAGYRGEEPLVDPMCGAGTILIEGTWIALHRAPGSRRRFAFEEWPSFDASAWREELEIARRAELSRPHDRIVGFDIHAGSLGVARRNARRADALDHLRLERADIRALPARKEQPPALVAANLPYGKRSGEPSKLKDLYRDLAGVLRAKFPGCRAVLLVPETKLGESVGIEVHQRLRVHNGGLRCQFLLGPIGA